MTEITTTSENSVGNQQLVISSSQNHKSWLFQKGVSGNPLGKPKGCKNKLTRLAEHITEENIQQIMQKLIEKAKWGHLDAIELLLNKIIPAPRPENVCLLEDETAEISEITLNNKEDIKQAGELIVKNMITGKISPSEANQMLALVERYAEIIRG